MMTIIFAEWLIYKNLMPYFYLRPWQTFGTPQAGFEPTQNLSPGSVEWSCAVMINATLRRHFQAILWIWSFFAFYYERFVRESCFLSLSEIAEVASHMLLLLLYFLPLSDLLIHNLFSRSYVDFVLSPSSYQIRYP